MAIRSILGATFATLLLSTGLWAAQPAPPVGVVSHVQVRSDKIEDVSSLEAWKKSFIKDAMSDRQKALAVWESVVKFRHQDAPANEFLQNEAHPHDPIKVFNVYGYGQCCCASAHIEALARHAGLQARGWAIIAHSVPEVFFDNAWHMLDASLLTYFPDSSGNIAGVQELTAGINDWYAKNPQFKGNDKELRKFMAANGWKKGPQVLANCPFYDANGWFMAATHGWYSTMQEYAEPSKIFPYEYGVALGYQVNVQLRPGQRLVRNWSNKGLHVNKLEGSKPGALAGAPGKDDLRYSPKYGDLAPGRIGNGLFEYNVPLASPALLAAAIQAQNLGQSTDASRPALHVRQADTPGVLTLRMPSSYVYLSGLVQLQAAIGAGGQITLAFSDNNGLDWHDLATLTAPGQHRIDLKDYVYRRYDYRLRFTLKGQGTGLSALSIAHDIQHSQRALPALDKGPNTITFAAGPAEGTITIEGSTNPKSKGKNLLLTAFHPQITGVKEGPLFLAGGKGQITFPIATPGDMTRLRIGCFYRARDKRDGWDVQASFDNGQTFTSIGRLEGPYPGNSKYLVFQDLPKGTRSALVRFAGVQANTTGIFDLRLDADYAEPAGGFAPVKVTYVWDENGAEQRHTHTARQPRDTYQITCPTKPLLKSLTIELE